MTETTHQAPRLLLRFDVHLWVLVLVFFAAGDLVTTAMGLVNGNIVERGPLAGPVIDAFGMEGMVGLKIGVLALFYVMWRAVPEPENVGIPLGLAVLGILVTGWNCFVLLASP